MRNVWLASDQPFKRMKGYDKAVAGLDASTIAQSTVLLLLLGFIFAAGQTYYLGFPYLSSFSYKDFVINAVLLIPFVFVVAFLVTLYEEMIGRPLRAVRALLQTSPKKKRTTSSLIVDVLELLMALIIPITIVSSFFWKYAWFVCGFAILILASISRRFRKIPGYDEKVRATRNPESGSFLTALKVPHWIILTYFAGLLSIDIQNTNEPDALIYTHNGTERAVNIVASNADVIAFSYRGNFDLVPRNEIERIEYTSNLATRLFGPLRSALSNRRAG